ncbi:fibroblast growth factor receptor substrate 2 isoform X2 [Macrosteles quadrilineatus]|uniref:fibroblast growth factor receptor substrate 2 isoform X2 n=1 Tax=Macrosteles quadrilineatus TaxID=74068 RepID=UPI0023E0F3B1|nr:fibroblast growth factor receptor substrate 2 isoform X2 [Macrosteles quadrilineatus]
MGCVTSKTDINDLHPNIFQVMNVDEMCNPLQPGQLEVSEADLVLHQRGKTPVRWPIKSLRRYGFDAQLFSFECGRRCPTGPGIFAFKCSRAEQLFNLLQTQMRNNAAGDDAVSNSTDFSQRFAESNYLEPAPVQFRQNGNRFSVHNGRLGSVGSSSNGPLSPLATSPSTPPPPPASNNNITAQEDKHCTLSHSYSNSTAISEACPGKDPPQPPLVLTTYANVDITPTSPKLEAEPAVEDVSNELSEESQFSPVYMNVIPKQEIILPIPSEPPPKPQSQMEVDLEERHCYANLEPGEIEILRSKDRYPPTFQLNTVTQPSTPPPQQINYILLDLDQTSSSSSLTGQGNQPTSPVTLNSGLSLTPESPNKPTEGYATIDFDRTVALCAVTCAVDDEGSRKTRHDSTMSDLTLAEEKEVKRTRHNSTISELMAPLASRLSSSLSD